MKPSLLILLWLLITLGFASVVAFVGPYVTGACLAAALFLRLRQVGRSG